MKKMLCTLLLCLLICSQVNAAECLNKRDGVFHNATGHKETYYNLKMNRVVKNMRNLGYSEEQYEYWIREDGVKMFGCLVMVAADLNMYHKGSIVHTSLGPGIVVDTGSAIVGKRFDIAVNW